MFLEIASAKALDCVRTAARNGKIVDTAGVAIACGGEGDLRLPKDGRTLDIHHPVKRGKPGCSQGQPQSSRFHGA